MKYSSTSVENMRDKERRLARVRSIANGMASAPSATMTSIAAIGLAADGLDGVKTKSGIKQVDRLLSSRGVPLQQAMSTWVKYVVGATGSITVAMDWTEYDDDDHTTLCVSLLATHGRATPLVWRTVKRSELKRTRTGHELDMVRTLRTWLPSGTHVEWLADQAFGYHELYELLGSFGWDYTIRFPAKTLVSSGDGPLLPASSHVLASGRACKLASPAVTNRRLPIAAAVFVKRKGMKEAWCLAASNAERPAQDTVRAYSRSFTIEEIFGDTTDITFGLGLRATHIGDAERRDRLLLLIAIAQALLTHLGAASEASGLDRTLKANTAKHRTMSLMNQGLRWYDYLARPTIRQEFIDSLLSAYEKILHEQTLLAELLLFDTKPTAQQQEPASNPEPP